jgi:hypothetical protein
MKMMLRPEDIREMCNKLKPVIGSKADKLWYGYLTGDEKQRKEMELNIQIISEKLLKTNPESEPILLTPPSITKSAGLFYIGNVLYNDKTLHSLYLSPEDFTKQIGLFSITGEGKTNTAFLFALELLKMKTPFLVIDWKRSWRNILTYKGRLPSLDFPLQNSFDLKDVHVFTIGRNTVPFLWNPFRPPPGVDPSVWVSTISEVLEKSHISGPGVAHYFSKIYSKFFQELKGHRDFYPNFYDGLHEIEKLKAYERELKWKQTAIRILTSFTIGEAAKSFNSRNPIKLEELLDKPVIFELDLELPKPLRIFFSEIILRWIHLYRLGQGETDKLKHVLFLEEVHNLFPKTRIEKETLSSLENVYRELRSFGQGIVSITQHPSLLPVYLLGNCHTLVFLGLQHELDIKAATQAMFLPWQQGNIFSKLKVGEAIVRIKNRIEPCLVKIPLVQIEKQAMKDNDLKKEMEGYLPYLPGKSGISEPIKDIYHSDNKDTLKSKYHIFQDKLLKDIANFPLSSITQRYKRLKINPKYGNYYKNRLIENESIKPVKIITRTGLVVLFEITGKGKALLREKGIFIEEKKEGIVHKFWKYKVAEYYQKQNYKIEIEKEINGKPDIIVENKDKRIAIEIETGYSDFLGNVRRNLNSGFSEIIVITTNKSAEEKIHSSLVQNNLGDKVRIVSALSFDILS